MTMNKVKRIALDITVLGDRQKTGIGVYVFNLIKGLLELNKKDEFILFGISDFKNYFYLKNLDFKNHPNVKIKIFPIPLKLFRRAFLLWQRINWPPIEFLIGEVDIFHSFNYYLPPQNRGKVVTTVFDMTIKLFSKVHQTKTVELEQVRLNRIKQKAHSVITISENSRRDFLKFDPKKWVEVIYPFVSANFLKKFGNQKSEQVLRKYKIERDYILAVGTLEPRKNVKALIEAYLKSNLKEKLVLVGSFGWEKSEVFRLIEKNRDKIITTGYVSNDDLLYLYKGALCLVYPSFYEGFGIPILEALTLGTAVICSKLSSMPEVGGKAVLYIDPKDPDSITEALIRVKHKSLRIKLVREGLKQAKKFSQEISARKLNQLYQQLSKVVQ